MSSLTSLIFGQKILLAEYITIRFGLSIVVSFFSMLFIMPRGIKWLKKIQVSGQPIRDKSDYKAEHANDVVIIDHSAKKGTPTMGGIFMIFSTIVSCLLFANLSEPKVFLTLWVMILFGGIGFCDDYAKLSKKSMSGIKGKKKFALQMIICMLVVYFAHFIDLVNTNLYFPLFKSLVIDLGCLYFIFSAIVITGSSNAVNLTDGLDGLVSMPIFLTAFTLAIVAYLAGNSIYSNYLHLPSVKQAGELSVICGAMMGSCLGFLWFNSKPACIFMGDTGSLSFGATLGIIAVFIKQEFILFIAGGIFVIEAMSVILQVVSYRLRNKKRIFLMAPIHHHFEKKGLKEEKVVIRFWIISFLFTILALALIKLR
jgi:phospho-N-acetylmuramoyl-pentapeptide-transferase